MDTVEEKLLEYYKPRILTLVKRYGSLAQNNQEIYNTCVEALLTEAKKSDKLRIKWVLNYRIFKNLPGFTNNYGHEKYIPHISNDLPVLTSNVDVEREVDNERVLEKVKKSLTDPVDCAIFNLRYFSDETASRRDVAEQLGITPYEVKLREKKIIKGVQA